MGVQGLANIHLKQDECCNVVHQGSSKPMACLYQSLSSTIIYMGTQAKIQHLSAKHFLLFLLHGALLHATPWLFEGIEHAIRRPCWMKHPCLAECCRAVWASCWDALYIHNISCATSYACFHTLELFCRKPAQKALVSSPLLCIRKMFVPWDHAQQNITNLPLQISQSWRQRAATGSIHRHDGGLWPTQALEFALASTQRRFAGWASRFVNFLNLSCWEISFANLYARTLTLLRDGRTISRWKNNQAQGKTKKVLALKNYYVMQFFQEIHPSNLLQGMQALFMASFLLCYKIWTWPHCPPFEKIYECLESSISIFRQSMTCGWFTGGFTWGKLRRKEFTGAALRSRPICCWITANGQCFLLFKACIREPHFFVWRTKLDLELHQRILHCTKGQGMPAKA